MTPLETIWGSLQDLVLIGLRGALEGLRPFDAEWEEDSKGILLNSLKRYLWALKSPSPCGAKVEVRRTGFWVTFEVLIWIVPHLQKFSFRFWDEMAERQRVIN